MSSRKHQQQNVSYKIQPYITGTEITKAVAAFLSAHWHLLLSINNAILSIAVHARISQLCSRSTAISSNQALLSLFKERSDPYGLVCDCRDYPWIHWRYLWKKENKKDHLLLQLWSSWNRGQCVYPIEFPNNLLSFFIMSVTYENAKNRCKIVKNTLT